jgi:hypothetical protein
MEHKCLIWIVWILMIVLFACPVRGADSQEERIARLEAQLAIMQQELAALKAEQAQAQVSRTPADPVEIQAAVASYMEQNQSSYTVPEWVKNVSIRGDFRYRYEMVDDNVSAGSRDRDRNRIQARVGIYGKVNEEVDFGFRLATGNNASPTSNNQDLDTSFSSKSIWLDLAYFDYHPESIRGLHVLGGKIVYPFYRPGGSDLMMDTDVTPEGIAVTYRKQIREGLDIFGSAGGFYVEERQLDADTSLWAVQGGATFGLNKERKLYLTAGGGYYHYGNVQGKSALGITANEFYGNSSAGNVFTSDFNIMQGFAELGWNAGGLPVVIFGDYLKNIRAASQEDTAYMAGVGVGKCTKPGTWAAGYNYRDVEADAVLGVLAEATFGGGGTDVKGHKFSFNYQLAENWQVGASYMAAERTRATTDDHNTFLLDLLFKF